MVKISSADSGANRELGRDSTIALAIVLIIIAYTLIRGCNPTAERQVRHSMLSFDAPRCEVMVNFDGNVRPVDLPLLKPVALPSGTDDASVTDISLSALETPIALSIPPANSPAQYVLPDGQELEKLLIAEGLADLADDSTAPPAWKILRDEARVTRRGVWSLSEE